MDNCPKSGNNLKAVDKLYSRRPGILLQIDLDYGGIAFWEFPERKKGTYYYQKGTYYYQNQRKKYLLRPKIKQKVPTTTKTE